jgi:serine/threonine protein kinase
MFLLYKFCRWDLLRVEGTGAGRAMDALQPGDPASVGGYWLLGRLGAGGMGQVYLGVSPGGRKVAVKLIHPVHAQAAQFRERFAREIDAARRVGGFHTAPVVDADPHAHPPWMITAYIEGPSLHEAVSRSGPLPPRGVRALGAGLAEGLGAIHACGLVHRDLKPGNVVMAEDGPRIIDFGIARAIEATTGITATGAVVGTYAFMSPEQIRGEVAGPASDVFSLGSVLAFAATGRPPFGSDSAVSIMFRLVNQPPDLAGLADEPLRGLITACLAKSTHDRPPVPAVLAALNTRGPAPDASGPRSAGPAAGNSTQRRAYPPGAPSTTAAGSGTIPLPGPTQPDGAPRARPSRRRPSRRLSFMLLAAAVITALAAGIPILLSGSGSPGTAAGRTPGTAAGRTPGTGVSARTSTTGKPSTSPSPAVIFGCKILQVGTGEEFNVHTVGGGRYRGTVDVSFQGYPGSGYIFPGTTVQGAVPGGTWRQVPAADIGASAEPYSCSASPR